MWIAEKQIQELLVDVKSICPFPYPTQILKASGKHVEMASVINTENGQRT